VAFSWALDPRCGARTCRLQTQAAITGNKTAPRVKPAGLFLKRPTSRSRLELGLYAFIRFVRARRPIRPRPTSSMPQVLTPAKLVPFAQGPAFVGESAVWL
jgi:hypothetical protein